MFAEISIYWKNDSNELMLLPEADVWPSGSDGMQVIGKEEDIQRLADFVRYERPSALECDPPTWIHTNEDLQEKFPNLRHFSPQDFTDDDGKPLDDIGMFERLGAEKETYFLCYYRRPDGTRSWSIDISADGSDVVESEIIETFTADIALETARQNFDVDGWVEHGIGLGEDS